MLLKTQATGPGIGALDARYVNITGDSMTGALGFTDGTVSSPSHFYVSDTDTGLYRPASNTLGFTAGGKDVVQMSASAGGDSTWATQRDFYILPGAGFGYNGYELLVGSATLAIQAGFSVITGSASTGSAQFSFRVGVGLTIGTSLRSDYQYAQTLWAVNDPNGNQMIYCYAPYFTHDFDHALATDTEVYFQASVDPDVTNNLWGMLRHNRTDFQIFSGAATGAGSSPSTVTNDIVMLPQGTERFRAIAGVGVKVSGGVQLKRTTVNAATYTALVTDCILNVTYASTGACTITLPAAATAGDGKIYTIKDAAGNAAVNAITIDGNGTETIDGALTAVMATNYQSIDIYTDGSNWFIK